MKLAIILSVSNYSTCASLPGCIKDGEIINFVLNKTQKYQEILYLNKIVESQILKKQLTQFVESHEGKDIEEIFFYFTGHGLFIENEFYYILSDYNERHKKTTSLVNSELDTLLKQLKAKLTIKVVDACQSQVQYIKEPKKLKNYLEVSGNHFNHCYFMFSSMNGQSSYQNNYISDFTFHFLKSLIGRKINSIRYKDIIDYISDEFTANNNQTPYFVTQGNFTEVFYNYEDNFEEDVEAALNEASFTHKNMDSQSDKFLALIKADALYYCSKEDVIDELEKIQFLVKEPFNSILKNLYDFKFEFKKAAEESKQNNLLVHIGKWLESNKHDFFAITTYEKRKIKKEIVKMNNLSDLFVSKNLFNPYVLEEPEYREYITGFKTLVDDIPFDLVEIDAYPGKEYPNIDLYNCLIVILFSKVNMSIFYIFSVYKKKGWDNNYEKTYSEEWKNKNIKIKEENAIKLLTKNISNEFRDYIVSNIELQFGYDRSDSRDQFNPQENTN